MTDVLGHAFVYLAAAVIGVPLAKRLGLGSVLGYLLAGIIIGPFVLGLVGHGGHDIMHFAEFGVVMMLFLVGLELKPMLLWELRRPIFGLGGAQVLATTLLVAAAAFAFGVAWRPALAVGMIFAMSSTAIVLQSLSERGQLRTGGGQAAFSVLLFQDIAVIPMLALFPLLADARGIQASGAPTRPGWLQAILVLLAVASVVLAGRYLVRPGFRWLAETRLREAFTAAALLLVVGIALLMNWVGLSPALGTFLAGVVLADSEYRHELESDIEPFKGLLLGLFFISVGAQIDFGYILRHPLLVLVIVLGTMTLKMLVLYGLGRGFGLDRPARWLFAFSLAQVGEFAFVLLSFGVASRVFSAQFSGPLIAVVALSMVMTPFAFLGLERWVLPRVAAGKNARDADAIEDPEHPVVIAGFGRFGQIVGRMLRANGVQTTVLDLDPSMVELLRRMGLPVHYGDASRPELLYAAGCERAKLFVLAIDDQEQAVTIVEMVRKHFPRLRILARARNRQHYYQLKEAGAEIVYRETFGSAFEMGIESLRSVGFRNNTAHRRARIWRDHEERSLQQLSPLWTGDRTEYFAAARRALEDAEQLMRSESPSTYKAADRAWDNESLREDVAARSG